MTRRAWLLVALSLLTPGLGHLVARRRPVEASLLLTFSALWGISGVVQISTLLAHIMHVGPEAYPGILAQTMLHAALFLLVGALAALLLLAETRARPAG